MKIRPYSVTILVIYSLILISIGLYFILIRPPFLSEDARFTGATLNEIIAVAPNFSHWLDKVFTVLGGFIISTGILTLYLAITSFRKRATGSAFIVALSGFTSIILMTVINFLIESDFKWQLIALTSLLGLSIFLYSLG